MEDNAFFVKTDTLLELLPHGSGINSDWDFDLIDEKIRAANVYSAMTEYGMYCCDYTFYVYFDTELNLLDLEVPHEDACDCGYGLGEYLWDTVYNSLTMPVS
jgi:hypothetical protein